METTKAYNDFTERLKILISEHPALITTTLSNIFTMRLIGNKTHGDLAEIAISEFINQYMYDFESIHVGKDLFRAKSQEEDIKIKNKITKIEFSISLKAYGDGPLQLSTDKTFSMFPLLENEEKKKGEITDREQIRNLLNNPAFLNFGETNVLPLIYDEKLKRCNILIFDYNRAHKSVSRIIYRKKVEGGGILFINFMIPKMIIFMKCVMEMPQQMYFNVDCGHILRRDANFLVVSPTVG